MADWILGEFGTSSALLKAVEQLRHEGHTRLDTYSPYPLQGSSEALGLSKSKIPLIALFSGLSGASVGYGIQWFTNAVNWPLNVGGRPPHSAPTFIPITFETGVLLAALSIFFGLWLILRLPQPYHPVFELDEFQNASISGYWLSVESDQGSPAKEQLIGRLRQMGAIQVSVVPERR